jgi:hypothetical protein
LRLTVCLSLAGVLATLWTLVVPVVAVVVFVLVVARMEDEKASASLPGETSSPS